MSKRGKAASGKGTKPVEVTPMPDISALSPLQQRKFLKEWLSIQKMRAWTDNLDKIMESVAYTALFLGQYGLYQEGQEDKIPPASVAAICTSLSYMLKDNHSDWAIGVVLVPVMAKLLGDWTWGYEETGNGGVIGIERGLGKRPSP